MPEYSDIYVISENRDQKTVIDFLNKFLPNRKESANEYELPQYAENPTTIFKAADELIKHCALTKNEEHAIYWQSTSHEKPEHAMLFYLKDGHAIYGLSTDAQDTEFVDKLLKEMQLHFNTELGYIAHECSPNADNISEFKAQKKAHECKHIPMTNSFFKTLWTKVKRG